MDRNNNPFRRLVAKALSIIALGSLVGDRSLSFWDHAIGGKLGGRSQFGFDTHKYHLKSHKYARRTGRVK